MSTEYRFDEPSLNVAQKIMECQATAAVDGWPDVRLKAAIQCLVIEAMKWVAPPAAERRTAVPGVYDVFEAIPDQLRSHYNLTPDAIDAVLLAVQGVQSRPAAPAAWSDVVAERQRQIEKGYTADHDDEHVCDEIAAMAAYYIMPEACRDWPTEETGYGDTLGKAIIPEGWPAPESPRWRRDDLIRGIAMAVAEVERLDRAETAPGGGHG